jgi:hypothetical protein
MPNPKSGYFRQITSEEGQNRIEEFETKLIKNVLDFYSQGTGEALAVKNYREDLEKYKKLNETMDFENSYDQSTWSWRRKVWDIATCPVSFALGNDIVDVDAGAPLLPRVSLCIHLHIRHFP